MTDSAQETGKTTLWVFADEMCDNHEKGCACMVGCDCERPASPSEIIEAARNLPGAEMVNSYTDRTGWTLIPAQGPVKPGRYLVIPIEGTD